jgi:hypothetical protein
MKPLRAYGCFCTSALAMESITGTNASVFASLTKTEPLPSTK